MKFTLAEWNLIYKAVSQYYERCALTKEESKNPDEQAHWESMCFCASNVLGKMNTEGI